ncbi:MAG: hypothetical protein RSC35_06765, partial [Mucinivorans sp.]
DNPKNTKKSPETIRKNKVLHEKLQMTFSTKSQRKLIFNHHPSQNTKTSAPENEKWPQSNTLH